MKRLVDPISFSLDSWGRRAMNLAAICLLLVVPAQAASGFQSGAAGEDGTHGEAGDPGAHGTDGTDGSNIVIEEFPEGQNYLDIYGGHGGYGGNGGEGVDGDDDNFWATGGNGGHGGRGGDAMLSFSNDYRTSAYATGGRGGFGGVFGNGSSRAFNGMGGNGGDGGNASLYFSAINNGVAGVTGGTGGSAFGNGATGGNGGQANLVAEFNNGSWSSRMNLNQYGGRGGHGWQGADGGHGAVAKFGFGQSRLDSTADTSGTYRTFSLRNVGGAGGDSQNGTGGNGGTGRVSLSAYRNLISDVPNTYYSASMEARGGSGGKGTTTGTQAAHGGRGAAGYFHATDTIQFNEGYSGFSYTLRAYGGNGGSALGRRGSGNGGFGAAAGMIGEQTIESTTERRSGYVTFNAFGGTGGHAQGTGIAGNGGNATYNDHFNLRSVSHGSLRVFTRAGNGGWGMNNGFGGDAIATADETFEDVEGMDVDTNLYHYMSAYGGHAGRGVAPARVAHGGDAQITIKETDTRSIRSYANAFAGQGTWGQSGDAIVNVDILTTSAERDEDVYHYAEGTGHATHVTDWNYQAAHGTNAVSTVNAVSEQGLARANSFAHGGWGFLSSGVGEATANADGATDAYAGARAFAFGDRSSDTDNHATSLATAVGVDRADASTVARTIGQSEYTQATSFATGKIATAQTRLSSKTDNWRTSSQFNLFAETTNEEPASISTVSTAASFRFLSDTPAEFQNASMETHVQLMPEQTYADSFVTDNSTFGDLFVDDTSADILGMGTIHGGMADGSSEPISVSADFSFELETRDFFNDQRLMFGLMNLENEGDGFSTLDASLYYGARMLFDESFTSGSEAADFFDNLMLDLGSMPLDRELMEFEFDVNMTFDDASDQFGIGFVFGNANGEQSAGPLNFSAVPEPGSISILSILAIYGCSRRRRRSVSC